jgi:hypothetical protein
MRIAYLHNMAKLQSRSFSLNVNRLRSELWSWQHIWTDPIGYRYNTPDEYNVELYTNNNNNNNNKADFESK